MKRSFIWAAFMAAILALILAGCVKSSISGNSASGKVQPITVEELKKLLAAGTDNNTVIVDLRESFLYKNSHVPGAIFIPFADFERQYAQLDKNKSIILVCHSGPMGEAAGQFLLTKGYTRVYNLEGGMRAWDEKA